jgi:subtilisin family serine protease
MQTTLSLSLQWARSRVSIAAALAIASLGMAPASSMAAPPERFATGRILVSPNPGLPAAEFNKIIKLHGANASRKLIGINVYVVEMPPGREKALAQALARNKHMKFAELDGAVTMQMTPSDPSYSSEWHLPMIQAPAAWDLATGAGVTIAVLDGGVDATHPDLAARIVPGWNF